MKTETTAATAGPAEAVLAEIESVPVLGVPDLAVLPAEARVVPAAAAGVKAVAAPAAPGAPGAAPVLAGPVTGVLVTTAGPHAANGPSRRPRPCIATPCWRRCVPSRSR
jgi:hypothetical protein